MFEKGSLKVWKGPVSHAPGRDSGNLGLQKDCGSEYRLSGEIGAGAGYFRN